MTTLFDEATLAASSMNADTLLGIDASDAWPVAKQIWMASRSLSSVARSRDPLARNDGRTG
jgi:hypothetical protein